MDKPSMQTNKIEFPPGFLWGTATASHQVEGGNQNNNWHLWEQIPGKILHGQKSGLACDWWNGRWKEDLDRAAQAGQNAHRLSLEWSRIQPSPGIWDDKALQTYQEIIQGILDRGMKPLVTLHHFTDPIWFIERGGWEKPDAIDAFASYVKKAVSFLAPLVNFWCTINEPNVYVYCGYLGGEFPPGKKNSFLAFKVMENMVKAHAAAYKAIHAIQPNAKVGIALNYRDMKPARPDSWLDSLIAGFHSKTYNDAFPVALQKGKLKFLFQRSAIPQAKGTQDFLGINYYTCDLVAFDLFKPSALFGRHFYPPGVPLSENKFLASVPSSMKEALLWAKKFGVPLVVSENGIEDSQDTLRPFYTVQHIYEMGKSIQEGCPVQGYFHWSLVDNFEWERAWTQRFGLWDLDVQTQERRKRPTVDIYADICKKNAISEEIWKKFGDKS